MIVYANPSWPISTVQCLSEREYQMLPTLRAFRPPGEKAGPTIPRVTILSGRIVINGPDSEASGSPKGLHDAIGRSGHFSTDAPFIWHGSRDLVGDSRSYRHRRGALFRSPPLRYWDVRLVVAAETADGSATAWISVVRVEPVDRHSRLSACRLAVKRSNNNSVIIAREEVHRLDGGPNE